MNRNELERALRSAGEVARDRDFFIFGSQAILGLVPRPPKKCLVSMELDIYPRHNYQAAPLIVKELGNRSLFSRKYGYFLDCVSPELATLPEGWTDRLVPFRTKNTGGVTDWCLEIHDLIISKLAAGRPKDLEYIAALPTRKFASPLIVEDRIDSVGTNAGTKETMRLVLKQILKPIKDARRKTRLAK
jgi:hypothetical protein